MVWGFEQPLHGRLLQKSKIYLLLEPATLCAVYGLKRMWMVPYTSEPNSTAVSLNSTNNTENNSGDVGTTSSLGSAAIAGIAVAAAVVAAVGIAGALYVRRRRRRHIEANPAWSRLSSKLLQSASATAGTTDLLLSVLQSKVRHAERFCTVVVQRTAPTSNFTACCGVKTME